MNYGKDIKLSDDGDVVITESGDLIIEESERIISQDLKEEASIAYGSVKWDKTAGSFFFKMLNNADFRDDDVIQELERLALKDPRIKADSVYAKKDSTGKFRLFYMPLDSIKEEALYFDLDTLFIGEDA